MTSAVSLQERWPALAAVPPALAWLSMRADLGLAHRTVDAYARGLSEYLVFSKASAADPLVAGRDHVARFVRHLTERPSQHASTDAALPSSVRPRLSNATIQQRLTAVRLFYDHLVEAGLRNTNPVGRGRYARGINKGGNRRGLVPRQTRLPWIPDEADWSAILEAARREPIRNRAMLALGYDAGLRREELCSLRTDDIDPGHRLLRVRAETTKSRRERMVPYSATAGELLRAYLAHRAKISRARGPLFLSESRRNCAKPLTPWTWSKVIRRIALTAGVPRFGTHTLRHLCLTDLARAGWELHAIATFAGHRHPATTLQYIHISGRELSAKLAHGMAQIHEWRVAMLAAIEPAGHA
jgi:integrase/recombinase XerD